MTWKNMVIDQIIQSDIFLMNTIKRYSWTEVLKEENLAEHSYYVSVIADLIAEDILERFPNKELDRWKILRFALYHDYEEIYTWDIVTPVKYKSDEVRNWIEKLGKMLLKEWANADFKWNSHISRRIKKSAFEYESKKDLDLENRIVKFADILQSLTYSIKEINLWNIYMEKILKNIIEILIQRYGSTIYFRTYIEQLLKVIEKEGLLKAEIVKIDWEKFRKMDPKFNK